MILCTIIWQIFRFFLLIPIYLLALLGALLVMCGFQKFCCYRLRNFAVVRNILLYVFTYDDYAETTLTAIVHSGANIPPGREVSVRFLCAADSGARFVYESRKSKDHAWEEPLTVTIEQGAKFVDVHVVQERQVIAKGQFPIDEIFSFQNAKDPRTKINLVKTLSSGL